MENANRAREIFEHSESVADLNNALQILVDVHDDAVDLLRRAIQIKIQTLRLP